jgi:hypothetical protein
MRIFFYGCFLLFWSVTLGGQPSFEWEYKGPKGQSQIVHDLLYLSSDQLAVVGEIYQSQKDKNGLFLVIDPHTGKEIYRKVFAKPGNNGFYSLDELDDGSLVLAGYHETLNHRSQGWLVHLQTEWDTPLLQDTLIGGPHDEVFHAVRATSLSDIFLAGYSEERKSQLWLTKYNGHLTTSKFIGQGLYDKLIDLEKTADGKLWLIAETGRSKTTRPGNLHICEINPDLGVENYHLVADPFWSRATSTSTYQQQLLICGTASGVHSDRDAWMKSVQTQDLQNNSGMNVALPQGNYSSDFDDFGRSALRSPFGGYWMGVYSGLNPVSGNFQLFRFNDDLELDKEVVNVPLPGFGLTKMVATYWDTYILAGTLQSPGKKVPPSIRLYCVKYQDLLAEKSIGQIDHQPPYIDDTQRGDGNGKLSPGEVATFNIEIVNNGSNNILTPQVFVDVRTEKPGFYLKQNKRLEALIPANGRKLFKFGVEGLPQLSYGKVMLDVKVKDRYGSILHAFSASIECLPEVKGGGEPVMVQRRTVFTTRDPNIKMKPTFIDQTPIKEEDFLVVKNGVRGKDEKAVDCIVQNQIKTGGRFQSEVWIQISDLQPGKNEVIIEYRGFQFEPITVVYEPNRPNLHVVAIGPKYPNLNYTTHDARDFTELMVAQHEQGFFGEIFIDTLIGMDAANENDLEGIFFELLNRANDQNRRDYIRPNDYLVVFYSGHGMEMNGEFHLVPSDFYPLIQTRGLEAAKRSTLINYKKVVLEQLNQIDCKKVVFLDACLSGGAKGDSSPELDQLMDYWKRANNSASGLITFASCKASQRSYEDTFWQNGAYTEALIEALSGEAVLTISEVDMKDITGIKMVEVEELAEYLARRVPELVRSRSKGGNQTPELVRNDMNGDFPLFQISQ